MSKDKSPSQLAIEDVAGLVLFFDSQVEESVLANAPAPYCIWALSSLMSKWKDANDFFIASLWRLIVITARCIGMDIFDFMPLDDVDEFVREKSMQQFGEMKTANELLTHCIEHYYPAIYNLNVSMLGCPTETEPAPPEFVAAMLLELHEYLYAATSVAYANETNLAEEMKYAIVKTLNFEYSSGIII